MFYVYILKCSDHSYYVGYTSNIEKRLAEHRAKRYAGYTSTRLPIECVFLESFFSQDSAQRAEKIIKKWTRRKKEFLILYGWEKMRGFDARDRAMNKEKN